MYMYIHARDVAQSEIHKLVLFTLIHSHNIIWEDKFKIQSRVYRDPVDNAIRAM